MICFCHICSPFDALCTIVLGRIESKNELHVLSVNRIRSFLFSLRISLNVQIIGGKDRRGELITNGMHGYSSFFREEKEREDERHTQLIFSSVPVPIARSSLTGNYSTLNGTEWTKQRTPTKV